MDDMGFFMDPPIYPYQGPEYSGLLQRTFLVVATFVSASAAINQPPPTIFAMLQPPQTFLVIRQPPRTFLAIQQPPRIVFSMLQPPQKHAKAGAPGINQEKSAIKFLDLKW